MNFEKEIQLLVELERDAHLIVVATGENSNLEKGWGRSSESQMHPVAFTNPIYVDTDGNGFQANGDTLDHPLLVADCLDNRRTSWVPPLHASSWVAHSSGKQ